MTSSQQEFLSEPLSQGVQPCFLMRRDGEASFMSARSFKLSSWCWEVEEAWAYLQLLVSTAVADREQKTTGSNSPNQTRLKQMVPHNIFGMRNSLYLVFDHHLGGRCKQVKPTNLYEKHVLSNLISRNGRKAGVVHCKSRSTLTSGHVSKDPEH